MSPNRNYISGRAFEYARMAYYRQQGYDVARTAGSHGRYDIYALGLSTGEVLCIQCKIVDSVGKAEAMLSKWKTNPPIPDRVTNKFKQVLEVKVKYEKGIRSATV